jgi:hypothetical protein
MLSDWLAGDGVSGGNQSRACGARTAARPARPRCLHAKQARELPDSIDVSTLVSLGDRTLIAVITFAFARIGRAGVRLLTVALSFPYLAVGWTSPEWSATTCSIASDLQAYC